MKTTMSESDWVVLRLLKVAVTVPHLTMRPDVVSSVQYLRKKYGTKHLNNCIDMLNAEKTK